MPRLISSRIQIHYEDTGTGPPLLLSHGVIENSQSWDEVVPFLSGRFRTVVYDARGRGRSQVPESVTFDDLVEDVHELVSHLGWRRFFHAGHSMGGRVALEHAATYPDEVAAIATISARPGAPNEVGRRAYADLIARTERMGTGTSVEMWARPEDAVYPRVRAISEGNPGSGTVKALRCLAEMTSFAPSLPKVQAPALFLAGSRDGAYVEAAEEMRAALPNARLRILDGIGHFPNLECPEMLAHELTAHFLAAALE